MAVSTPTLVAVGKLHYLLPNARSSLPLQTVKCNSCNFNQNPSFPSSVGESNSKASLELVSTNKRRFLQVGLSILASSVMVSVPFDANATRIEYYATVGEPSCDMNFAKSGLGYCDVAIGTGPEAPQGELINIHYTARFADGTVFDSSYKRARPLTMRIGVGKVIRGLDQGILGGGGVPPMLVGGKRKLHIPPQLAYGPEPAGCFSVGAIIPTTRAHLLMQRSTILKVYGYSDRVANEVMKKQAVATQCDRAG